MKTLFKILRSIATSLFLITLTLTITLQFIFTTIRKHDIRIPDLIDREQIVYMIADEDLIRNNKLIYELLENYIDKYINYVFYKRSYPVITLPDIPNETIKRIATTFVENFKQKIDLDYETVLKIRSINNFLSNGSIYLLINIGIMTLVIIISVINKSLLKGVKYSSFALLFASIFILIGSIVVKKIFLDLTNPYSNVIYDILNKAYFDNYLNIALTYLGIGLFLIILTTIGKKIVDKHTDKVI